MTCPLWARDIQAESLDQLLSRTPQLAKLGGEDEKAMTKTPLQICAFPSLPPTREWLSGAEKQQP